jgi:hypothetical protein
MLNQFRQARRSPRIEPLFGEKGREQTGELIGGFNSDLQG